MSGASQDSGCTVRSADEGEMFGCGNIRPGMRVAVRPGGGRRARRRGLCYCSHGDKEQAHRRGWKIGKCRACSGSTNEAGHRMRRMHVGCRQGTAIHSQYQYTLSQESKTIDLELKTLIYRRLAWNAASLRQHRAVTDGRIRSDTCPSSSP